MRTPDQITAEARIEDATRATVETTLAPLREALASLDQRIRFLERRRSQG